MPSSPTPRVFISYSSKDANLVDGLKTALADADVTVWLDHEQLTPGTPDWRTAVLRGIEQATTVIYVASPDAASSKYVAHELAIAEGEGKTILPFWIRGEKWYFCAPFGFYVTQHIDARDAAYTSGLVKLVDTLNDASTLLMPASPALPVTLSSTQELPTVSEPPRANNSIPAPITPPATTASMSPVIEALPASEATPVSEPMPPRVATPTSEHSSAPAAPTVSPVSTPQVIELPPASESSPTPAAPTPTPAASPPAGEPKRVPASPPVTPVSSSLTSKPPVNEPRRVSEPPSGGLLARFGAASGEPSTESADTTGASATSQPWWRRAMGGMQSRKPSGQDWRATDFSASDLDHWDRVGERPFAAPPDSDARWRDDEPRGRGRPSSRGNREPRGNRWNDGEVDGGWDGDWETGSWDAAWAADDEPWGSPRVMTDRLTKLGFRSVNVKGTLAIIPPLVSVAPGPFLMGSDSYRDSQAFGDEKPQRPVDVAHFLIAKYTVTVAEYALAVRARAVRQPPTSGAVTWQTQLQRLDHPVVCVSWQDTQVYVAWLRTATGESGWRLPTEAEWEKAARWDAQAGVSRVYPWGDTFDKNRCATAESGIGHIMPIGSHPANDPRRSGASPRGAEDMAGNVWEWTSSIFKPYPYRATDGREALEASDARTQRGGSWSSNARVARAAFRVCAKWDDCNSGFGFRLAYSPESAGKRGDWG
jgi:toxoflavin biosynthesis protein ToxD